jgi:hypothetical protein
MPSAQRGKVKKLLLILVVLITLFSVFSVGCKSQVMAVTTDRLYYDYKTDAVAADQMYKDKTLQVTGIISGIGVAGSPYILFYNGMDPGVCGVQCIFSGSYASQLASLSVGQTVTLSAKFKGYYANVVLLEAN